MNLNEDENKVATIVFHNKSALEQIQEFVDAALDSGDPYVIATNFGLIASKASREAERLLGERASKELITLMIAEAKSLEAETEDRTHSQVAEASEKIPEALNAELKRRFNFDDEDIELINAVQMSREVEDDHVIQNCSGCGKAVLSGSLDLHHELPKSSSYLEHFGNSYCKGCAESAEQAIEHETAIGASKIFCLGLVSEEINRLKEELLDSAEANSTNPIGRERMAFTAFSNSDIDLRDFPYAEEAIAICQDYWTREEQQRGIERLHAIQFAEWED